MPCIIRQGGVGVMAMLERETTHDSFGLAIALSQKKQENDSTIII